MLPEKIEINRQPVFQITNNNPDLIFDTTPIDGGNTLKGSDSYSIAYGHTKGYRRLNVSRFDDYNGLIIYQNNDEENEVFCGYFPLASPIPGYPYLQEILVDAAFLGFNGVTVKYLGHPDRLILENLEQKIISLSTKKIIAPLANSKIDQKPLQIERIPTDIQVPNQKPLITQPLDLTILLNFSVLVDQPELNNTIQAQIITQDKDGIIRIISINSKDNFYINPENYEKYLERLAQLTLILNDLDLQQINPLKDNFTETLIEFIKTGKIPEELQFLITLPEQHPINIEQQRIKELQEDALKLVNTV